jgi:hypothetical protein
VVIPGVEKRAKNWIAEGSERSGPGDVHKTPNPQPCLSKKVLVDGFRCLCNGAYTRK